MLVSNLPPETTADAWVPLAIKVIVLQDGEDRGVAPRPFLSLQKGHPGSSPYCLVLLQGAEAARSLPALQLVQSTLCRDISLGFQRFPACPLAGWQVPATTLFFEPGGRLRSRWVTAPTENAGDFCCTQLHEPDW